MNIVQGCFDCDIATGKRAPIGGIIYEDDDWIINHADPKILGHLIVKPKSHYHIIPRYKGMPAHAAKVLQAFDDNKYTCTEEEILSTVEKIRTELARLV